MAGQRDRRPQPAITDVTSSHDSRAEQDLSETAQRMLWQAISVTKLGEIVYKRGELETAAEYHEESLALFRDLGDRHSEARALGALGGCARARGEVETAVEYFEESLGLCREIGDCRGEATALDNLGQVACEQGSLERARARARFAEAADRLVTMGVAGEAAAALTNVVDVCDQQGDSDAALEWCERAIEFAEQTGRDDMREEVTTRRAALTDTNEA